MAKALLIGVSDYSKNDGCTNLPICRNDIYAVRESLMSGLNFSEDSIDLLGELNSVTIDDVRSSLSQITSEENDTFILYFSGHGGDNALCLSDCNLDLQNLIDFIEQLSFKNKIIILDCCHAGGFSVSKTPEIDLNKTADFFVGYGYAVLASCASDQNSGFHPTRRLSLYTSFICDAFQFRSIIKEGKKSLEEIQELIYHLAQIWNKQNPHKIQKPVFRENIGGTIFFEVEDYCPYRREIVFEETEKYIIYEVEPLHTASAKRYAVKVILRQIYDLQQLSKISIEITNKAKCYEVYNNARSSLNKKGVSTNIVWCYFGYDESDVINGRYAYISTWVDDFQDKNWWYRQSKDTFIVNNVHFKELSYYSMLKSLCSPTISNEQLVKETNKITSEMINIAAQYIRYFREFQNTTISEKDFIETVSDFSDKIDRLFIKQSNLPVAPDELYDWSQANIQIACSIHDFSLFYNKKNLDKWESENRKWLVQNSIKNYENDLQTLKEVII